MSFDDHLNVRPRAQQTERSSAAQIVAARKACARWVHANETDQPDALRDLLEMLGLGRGVDERVRDAS